MRFLKPFFFGIFAALGALLLELLVSFFLGAPSDLRPVFFSKMNLLLAVIILIEEIFIFIFVYKNFQELKNASQKEIFYNSVALGLGFSFLEIFFNLFDLPSGQNILNLVLNFTGITAVHIATAGIIGYSIMKAPKLNIVFIFRTLLIAFSIHFVYNYLIIYNLA